MGDLYHLVTSLKSKETKEHLWRKGNQNETITGAETQMTKTLRSRAIGWESVLWRRRIKLAWQEKPQGYITMRVTPMWHTQSNKSGYFYNASPGTHGKRSREWKIWYGKLFASYFLHKDKILLAHCRSSEYNDGQEIWIGTPESSDISEGRIHKFSAEKHITNLGRDGWSRTLQLQPPPGVQGRKVWW